MNYAHVVGSFHKNSQEVVKVTLDEFHGREVVDIRAYFSDVNGEWQPSRKGITLSIECIPELLEIVRMAKVTLIDNGRLEDECGAYAK